MDFKDQIKLLGEKISKLKEQILTEEATKNAFIMPFIQSLGYDVFNPIEVVPEFVADIGTKKGEKIDYAIFKDGEPIILIECKHWGQNLNLHDNQLLRYFHVSKAKFAILTNGISYRFYSDLVEPNKMDEKPFLEFDITEVKDNQVEELKKFHKSYFNAVLITNTASELKYLSELKGLLHNELNDPSSEFVKYFAKQVYPSIITSKILDSFTNLIKKSAQQYISDLITDRFEKALSKDLQNREVDGDSIVVASETSQEENKREVKIDTTELEIEAFMLVKSILRQHIDPSRITYKDTINYLSILLDSNIRKSICRLYLNGNKKYIALFDESKKEVKNEINSIDDIYNFSEQLKNSLMVIETIES